MSLNEFLERILYIEMLVVSAALAYALGDEIQTKIKLIEPAKYLLMLIMTFVIFRFISRIVDVVHVDEDR